MPGIAAVALLAASLSNAVITQPVANMYSAPSADSDVVSQAIYGSNVGISERKAGWARIRTADDYLGWVPESVFRQGPPYPGGGRVAQVSSLFAHIYREPDLTKHAPLITVPFETRLAVTADAKDGRWLPVRLPDDRAGWVQLGDVAFESKTLSAPETAEFSKRFLGIPYTWGGTSTFGYDCSGFTQMLIRRRGLLMPRDSQPQANWSGVTPIAQRKDLQPGDLLFFGASASRITHTGMYLGEGKFISATTHQVPTVRIDSLDDPYWAKLLVAMRRVK
jgi:SH3-like domain-containing protein